MHAVTLDTFVARSSAPAYCKRAFTVRRCIYVSSLLTRPFTGIRAVAFSPVRAGRKMAVYFRLLCQTNGMNGFVSDFADFHGLHPSGMFWYRAARAILNSLVYDGGTRKKGGEKRRNYSNNKNNNSSLFQRGEIATANAFKHYILYTGSTLLLRISR